MQIGVGTLVILCASVQCLLATPGKSQPIDKVKIELELKNETLIRAFKKMEGVSPFHFMYKKEDIRDIQNLYMPGDVQTVEAFLKILLSNTSLTFRQVNNQVLIKKLTVDKKKPSATTSDDDDNISIKFDKIISGQVTNSKDQPLEGVSIMAKGTATGTTTDAGGRYSMTVPDNATLIFSYIGFLAQEIAVGNRKSIDISLQEDSRSLSDVVVTALGVRRNVKSLTYSTQTVNTQQLTEAREPNLLASLKGKVAGLTVTSSGAGVGGDVRVVLRGNRSIDGDSQPLYVIDGVPLNTPPSSLSPDNIASINVLKGANASALYGSAASNGVIVIETKKGVSSGLKISLNQTFMVEQAYKLLPFQNEYGQGTSGVYGKESESAWGPKLTGSMVDTWSLDPEDAGKKYPYSANPDNKMDVFQKGFNMATNLVAMVGGDKTQAVFSYTFTNAKGILPNNTLKRHNVSTRLISKLTSKLTLDARVELIDQGINNKTIEGGSNLNPVQQIYTLPSNIRTADLEHYEFTAFGKTSQNWWNPSSNTGENPYWVLNRDENTANTRRSIFLASLGYNFTNELKLMLRTSYEAASMRWDRKWHNDTYNVAVAGSYWVGHGEDNYLNNDALLSYNKEINKDWTIGANVGGSLQKWRSNSMYANTGDGLLAPNVFSLSNTNLPVVVGNPGPKINLNSVYAFTTLSWKNAIYLDITGRNEWSSTLPDQSFFYPSVGISTVLTDLVPKLPEIISFAKIRASYAGSANATGFARTKRFANFTAGGTNGFLELDYITPDSSLRPEQTRSLEFGADLRFFKGRVGIDFTYYKTNTTDQLIPIFLPVGSGASVLYKNAGDVQNKGVEIVLSLAPVKTSFFSWDCNINFAANKNMVLNTSQESPMLIIPADDSYFKDYVIEQGAPYGQIYVRGWQRDAQNRVIVGTDGLPVITDGRSVFAANFAPKWIGGISNTLTYKNFIISFLIDRRHGGTMVSASNAVLDGAGLTERTLQGRDGSLVFGENFFGHEDAVLENGSKNNVAVSAEYFWTNIGGVNDPKGEAFISDASSTRFRELTVGYSLPKSMIKKIRLEDAKISLVGRNLFFISRASEYVDPDIMLGTDKTSEGFQSFNPPSSRYYGINLKIGF